MRNSEAILDAAEDLLRGGGRATVPAVAAECGLSRVTVYAYFRDANEMLEAVVARAVRRGDRDTEWLLRCFVALVDMAHDEVRAGRVDAERALQELSTTIAGMFTGGAASGTASR